MYERGERDRDREKRQTQRDRETEKQTLRLGDQMDGCVGPIYSNPRVNV